jgi:NAD(P)-dependent dehydrogenase (short-subunit alcohol dehydrogenase family)
MPDFKALTSTLTFQNTNVIVIDGTQDIGAAIAICIAELGASIFIVSHNKMLGSDMVKKLENASFSSGGDNHGGVRFGFLQRDLSRVGEIKGAVKDIAKWAEKDGIHYLFQSQGE